ncbi:hypothetical protein WANG_p1158 (plasmid) [Lactobacillus kefiranofaciens subsp. kefiranofaciens]|nr:hypothetical protein WANG_p1158 [Lactobacillus kefiranofaciens subsp. kefiranofaciens]
MITSVFHSTEEFISKVCLETKTKQKNQKIIFLESGETLFLSEASR